jgi:hypothetical protein
VKASGHQCIAEHEVGLLDDLLAVDLEVGLVQQQRVGVLLALEVPLVVAGELLGLRVDAQPLVVRDVHRAAARRQTARSSGVTASASATSGCRLAPVGGHLQVARGQQVREDVVVDQGRVLVGAGHPVHVPLPVRVVVAERDPQASRLHEELQPALALEAVVAGHQPVPLDGVRDHRVDVERRGAGRPVRRALLPADRPPREGRALQPELLAPLLGEVERRVPPAQDVAGGVRGGRREGLQDEALGVPERVPVVARAGQPLGRDRPPLGAGAGLQDVEQPEAHGLLHDGVAVDLDVGAVPVVVEVGALAAQQALPAAVARAGQRRRHLVAHRGRRAGARPAVGQELHDLQLLAGLETADDRRAGPVVAGVGLLLHPARER